MFEQQQQEQVFSNASNNEDAINNASFMIMRLDTSPLMRKIRKDIGGKEIYVYKDKDGEYSEREKQVGMPLANEEGVMHITNMVEEIVNSHTVQGNLKGDHYWDFVCDCREEVTNAIVLNCYDWGIEDQYLSYIIDKIMRLIELFLTRPVDNKEREGFARAFQSREVHHTGKKDSPLSSFAGGIK